MATNLKLPQPGDLITAQDMTNLITTLQALDVRVTQLEQLLPGADGKVTILDLQWNGTDLHLGDELRIVGLNLGLQGETHVDFGTAASVVTFKPGSDDQRILLDVPTFAIAGGSKSLVLTVARAGVGSDSRNLTVFQGVPTTPDGTINFQPAQFPIGTVVPGQNLTVTFPLVIPELNMDAQFDITTTAKLNLQQPLTLPTQALNDVNQAITTITLPKSHEQASTRTLKVRISIPNLPQGVATVPADVTVSLSAVDNPALRPSSGVVPFIVGAAAPPPGAFSIGVSAVGNGGSFDPASGTLHLPSASAPANGYRVDIKADLSDMTAGEQFTIATKFASAAPKWLITGPTSVSVQIPGPVGTTFRITPLNGATSDTLTFTFSGQTAQHTSTATFGVDPTASQ